MKVSKKWLKTAQLYKFFSKDYQGLDFSDSAAEAMYNYETYGEGRVTYHEKVDGLYNGFAVGKHLMDIQIATWNEDLRRPFMLTKYELLNDPELKEIKWFLEQLYGKVQLDVFDNKQPCLKALNKYLKVYLV